ncbi:MAG TPA: DUF4386 domain-containing protein [Gemmatimonadales bacterium]|nr:DUF4386 domain-containing protein [Gemmatimonadales bacterium]
MSTAEGRIRRTARLAGGLYLALMPVSAFGILYVPAVLVVRGDAAATARNIMASEWLFRSGTVSHLITQIIFVFLALALYQLLKPVNKGHAVLMVALALLGVPIAFVNEVNHLAALRLLSGAAYLEPFTAVQRQAQAMLFLDLWESGILVAQVFWALWLFPLGCLVFRSGFLPRLLGILLIIAGGGYLVDVVLALLFPDIELRIGYFTFVGELLLPLWLVFKGVKVEAWEQADAR